MNALFRAFKGVGCAHGVKIEMEGSGAIITPQAANLAMELAREVDTALSSGQDASAAVRMELIQRILAGKLEIPGGPRETARAILNIRQGGCFGGEQKIRTVPAGDGADPNDWIA